MIPSRAEGRTESHNVDRHNSMQPDVELEAALNRKFFQHVEALGFIRDVRQEPRITCFRRRTETTTRIFSVLRGPFAGPRFRILFTEAPLTGIDYARRHLPPEDINLGNFALPQGWLRSAPGKMWFGTPNSLWRRLRSAGIGRPG